jgi:hypothetical protein
VALRWTTVEKVVRVGVVMRWLYLTAKALRVGPVRRCVVLSLQWAWIFGGELTIRVSAVHVKEALGRGSQEPGRVLSWVMRSARNQRPSVPWVQDPDKGCVDAAAANGILWGGS